MALWPSLATCAEAVLPHTLLWLPAEIPPWLERGLRAPGWTVSEACLHRLRSRQSRGGAESGRPRGGQKSWLPGPTLESAALLWDSALGGSGKGAALDLLAERVQFHTE